MSKVTKKRLQDLEAGDWVYEFTLQAGEDTVVSLVKEAEVVSADDETICTASGAYRRFTGISNEVSGDPNHIAMAPWQTRRRPAVREVTGFLDEEGALALIASDESRRGAGEVLLVLIAKAEGPETPPTRREILLKALEPQALDMHLACDRTEAYRKGDKAPSWLGATIWSEPNWREWEPEEQEQRLRWLVEDYSKSRDEMLQVCWMVRSAMIASAYEGEAKDALADAEHILKDITEETIRALTGPPVAWKINEAVNALHRVADASAAWIGDY